MDNVFVFTDSSSLSDLVSANESFDYGVLRICYTGADRNGFFISKEAIQNSLSSIHNVPIVCNYKREEDSLGGHDMELVVGQDNSYKVVNCTQPIGVVPESAKVWFETTPDENDVEHEYLCAEALLWKRQEAYQKVKDMGTVPQSMEITIQDSDTQDDGLIHINKFTFTAFTLISETPCFEGASLEVFSRKQLESFKEQMAEMMDDMKNSFNLVNTSTNDEVDDTSKISQEGGNTTVEGNTTEVKTAEEPVVEENNVEPAVEDTTTFRLASATKDALRTAIKNAGKIMVDADRDEYGNVSGYEISKYYLADFDPDNKKVYLEDNSDGNLYMFDYVEDGDNISIDFDSAVRCKMDIVEYDEGTGAAFSIQNFGFISDLEKEAGLATYQLNAKADELSKANEELFELREYKTNNEKAIAAEARNAVFSKFDDLNGNEEFESLKSDCGDISVNDLTEKCFAIRGKNMTNAKATFSANDKTTKLAVDKNDSRDEDTYEPYGDLFKTYGDK